MKSNISMSEIAKLFNVSKVTVSKALNDKEGVSDELRAEIKAKASELGYRINSNARGLKTKKTTNIGIVIPNRFIGVETSYYFGVYTKMVTKFNELGFSVILEILSSDSEKEVQYPDMYINQKIDGLIVLGQLNDEYLQLFEDFDIPVVYFDFYVHDSKVDSITTDNFYSGYAITDLLIKNGHKEIGFVGNLYSTSSIQDRFLGFYRAMLEHKLPINYDYNINDRDDEGKLIDLVLPKTMPTAFVCNNDQVAYSLIKVLSAKNIKVPDDCSVVSFDNTTYSLNSEPKITTVDNNVDEMVDVACKVVIKKIDNPNKVYNRILIKTTICNRESVKKIN